MQAVATSTATANPATEAASSVPDRTSRSWPPPCRTGTTSTSRRTSSAPTPTGPPTLCPDTVIASTPEPPKSTGRWATACTASECTGTPWRRAIWTISSTGWTVPTSLLAHMTVTSATDAGSRSIAARSASTSTRPSRSTGSHSTAAPSAAASHRTASRTAWCSTAEARIRLRRGSAVRRAQNRPFTARLSASVPPAVNTTSPGRAPSAAAMLSRDSSTTLRAARPEACSDDGLPSMRNRAATASTTSGRTGVVAAWSRYTRAPVMTPSGYVALTTATGLSPCV